MSFCCINCFADDHLVNYIKENGSRGSCDFCGRKNTKCIEPTELADLFRPVLDLYSIVEDFMPLELLKELDGDFIWTKLDQDWQIFNDLDSGDQERLLEDMFPSSYKDGDMPVLSSYVEMESEYWGTDLEITEALIKEWDEFCSEVKWQNRFFPQKRLNLDRLGGLLPFLSLEIKKRTYLYRARICQQKLRPSKMGKPPAEKSKHGRANPRGIPYLYLASDAETAAREVRPNIFEKVTVGKFRIKNPLRIVDLRKPIIGSPFRYNYDLDFVIENIGFLSKLGTEISKPIDPKDSDLEYLPLQYLCEFIKNEEFDGIAYRSSLGGGYNIAVFDDSKVKCIETDLYKLNVQLEEGEEEEEE